MTQCNLHQHSEGSFLDGLASVKEIARRAHEVGSDAVSINDHNECNQHIAFQQACRAEDIHPVLGIEADWVYDIAATRKLHYPTNRSHICLLAEDNIGLSNIWALSTLAYTEKYRYYKPLITPELMREYRQGIFASDGCMITEFGRAVEAGDEERARQHFSLLLDIYGDHFYSELHTWRYIDPDTAEKKRLNDLMHDINHAKVSLATQMGVPMVIVNDSHHAWPEQWENKELVWKFSISKKKKGDDQDITDYGQKADHLMGGDEAARWMREYGVAEDIITEAIKNSHRIAHSCHAEITRTLDLPRLTRSEVDDLRLLIKGVEEGFKQKITDRGLPEDVYHQRLGEEMQLIAAKGFAGYFNVTQDEVSAAVSGEWAPYIKSKNPRIPLLCGPGRGSGGGSLVNYLLGITAIDPIHYDLLFERFLAPGRQGWPDIDVDFPQAHRSGMKQYLEHRHGHDNVCTIGTLTRSQPKALLRDLGRAMDIPLSEINKMSKIIDQVQIIEAEVDEGQEGPTWEEIVEKKGGELSQWQQIYPRLFDRIREMAGIVRQSSRHASGVVVSNKPLLGNIPLRVVYGQQITQFDMYQVEELGALKLDLLGLRHLDTLMVAREKIYERHGVWLDFRDDRLPWALRGGKNGPPNPGEDRVQTFGYSEYADPAIWPQIHAGHTLGIFQVETPGLTRAAMQLKPLNEKDVAALIAIVRPGVRDAGLDTVYLSRRADDESVTYDHPLLESITKDTYGVLIYQEQLIRTVKDLAGFSPDEAGTLLKALSKKWMDKVKGFKEQFLEGCLSNLDFVRPWHDEPWASLDEKTRVKCRGIAEKIWASIEASGRYAFNKSHAVGYAIIATWEVWCKHYYPLEFQWALKVTDPENVNRYVRESRRLGFKILPPDINRSEPRFSIEGNDAVRYGIESLDGIGAAMSKDIRAGRPYTSFDDYLLRCGKGANKKTVSSLICIGALDCLGDRAELLRELEYRRVINGLAESTLANPTRLAGVVDRRLAKPQNQIEVPDFSDPEVIYKIESDLLGTYCTVDPLEPYLTAISNLCLNDPNEMTDIAPKTEFLIGGQLASVKVHKVRKQGKLFNREMAFLAIEWNGATFDVTAFPEMWDACKYLLDPGVPVMLHVVRDSRGGCILKNLERLDVFFA